MANLPDRTPATNMTIPIRSVVKWIKEAKTSVAERKTSTLAESEQLTEFVKFLAAPHPMSAEVAQHIQQMTVTMTNVISKSNAAMGEKCAVFKALKQLQPILEVFLDDNSSAKAMTTGVIEYARKQHAVEDVEDAETTNAGESENQDGDNNHLNVTPIQLNHQEVEEGNLSPSAFSPDQYYRFEAVAHSSEPDHTDILLPEPSSDGCPSSPPQQESNSPSYSPASDSDDLPAELNDPTDDLPAEPDATTQYGKMKSLPSSETPSKKPKPMPDRYRFDITRYWKDAPREIQTRIEERFERMEPQKKMYDGVNIDPVKWNAFFWIPEKTQRDLLDNWPPMIQELSRRLPKPSTFSLEKMIHDPSYARFRALYQKLREPKMLATAWERTHTIHPNNNQLEKYVTERRSRSNLLRKLWGRYSEEVKRLVFGKRLPWEVIADLSLPLPPKHQHPWDPVDPDNLQESLEIADNAEPVRVYYATDDPEPPQPQPVAAKANGKRRARNTQRIGKQVRFATTPTADSTKDDGYIFRS